MTAAAVTVRSAPPLRAMAMMMTPAVPTTPKELPKAIQNTAGNRKATSTKVRGVMRATPAWTKKATVPPARHRAPSRPMRIRMRNTRQEVATPAVAIPSRARRGWPRWRPTPRKQNSPTTRAQARDSPPAIHPATQARKIPIPIQRSICSLLSSRPPDARRFSPADYTISAPVCHLPGGDFFPVRRKGAQFPLSFFPLLCYSRVEFVCKGWVPQ